MAEPWEQDWSQTGQAPAQSAAPPWEQNWEQQAPVKKSFVEKLGDTWPARLAKGIYSGVTLPGDVMAGKIAVDPEDPQFMGRLMDLTSVAAPMSPKVGATVEPIAAAAAPTREALDAAANAGYKSARSSPLVIDASAVKDLASNIQAGLAEKGILKEFAPDTHAVLDHIQTAEPGAVATGNNLLSVREALRNASQNFNNPREAKAANEAISQLDSFIQKPPAESVLAGDPAEFAKTAADARGNYAAARRAELIEDELETARRNAASANSGRNVDNAERQRFNAITKSDKKSAGFSEDELGQMDKIIFGTPTGNALSTGGNMLGGGGGLGAAVYGLGSTFNPWLASAPAIGWAMKKGADAITTRNINKLDEMVRSRSPLAEATPPSTALTPVQEAQRSLLIRSLMNPALLDSQQPNQSDLIAQMLQGGGR